MAQKEKSALVRAALDGYEEEYSDNWRHWEALDGKANSTISAAGILLGSLVAFGDRFSSLNGSFRLFAVGSVILSIATVALAILASRIATVPSPPAGRDIALEAADLIALGDGLTEDHAFRFLHGRLASWRNVSESTERALGRKAGFVELAQCTLMACIVLAAVPSIAAFASLAPSAPPTTEVHNEVHQEWLR